MSNANAPKDENSKPAVASIPKIHLLPQEAPSRPPATEHGHLHSAGRAAAASTTTPSDDNILSKTRGDATTPGTASEKFISSAMTRDPQEHMQRHQGCPPEIFVTDVDAESMICCNGSVDGSIQDGVLFGSTFDPDEDKLCSYPLQCILMSTEYLFDPGVSKSRPSRVQREVDWFDRCFAA